MTGERNINRKKVNYRAAGRIKKKVKKQQIKRQALSTKTQPQPKKIEDMTKKERREQVKKQKKQQKKLKKQQLKEQKAAEMEEEV